MKIATLMSIYYRDDPILLARAIDSILDQKIQGDVVSHLYLAIDGRVTDEIYAVINERTQKIFKVVQLPVNQGLACALNILIGHLEDEELVFRMDADDYSLPNRYCAQIDFLQTHPDVDIVGTDITEVDIATGYRQVVVFYRGSKDLFARLAKGVPVAHPTVCFRRKVLDMVGGYPVSGTNEDIALWFICAGNGFRFDNVPEPLLEFTISPNFWQRRSFKKAVNELVCYMSGIWSLQPMTWRYVYPLLRFFVRLQPPFIASWLYRSGVRGR